MRSKYSRRSTEAQGRGGNGASQVVIGLMLVVLGATLGIAGEHVTGLSGGGSKPANVASLPTIVPSPFGTAAAASSPPGSPAPTPTSAAPVLEAAMPTSINGTKLTVITVLDATSLGRAPSNRALDAGVTKLGLKPANLELADAVDQAGTLQVSVVGFRLPGLDPARLREVVLDSLLAASTPGVTQTPVTLSGVQATKVSYGDSGPSEYLFIHGDSLFLVETSDETLAGDAVAATLAAGSPSVVPSAGASPATSPGSSTLPSSSPAPS